MTDLLPTNDHSIVRVTDAGIFYRASALGGCFRALWAARNGHEPKPPPDSMQTIFDTGHEIEDLVLTQLEALGWNIYSRQKEIVIPVPIDTPIPCFIVGHLDALGSPPEGLNPLDPEAHLFEHVIEVKGFGPDYFSKWQQSGLDAWPRYKIQKACYTLGVPCGDTIEVIWEKATQRMHFRFSPNTIPEWELHALVLAVEEMYATGRIPTCTNEYPCPYYYLHDPKDAPMPLDAIQDTFVTAYLNLSEQIKLLENARKTISDNLKESIAWADGQPMSYDASGAVVVVTMNPSSLNRTKIFELLTSAGEDPEDYLTPSSGYHLRINAKKDRPS